MFDQRAFLDDLRTVVNIDSNSYYPEGLLEVGNEYTKIAERFGLKVTRHKLSDQTGELLEITNHGITDRYDVLMMGHMDTVQPVGTVKVRPYSEDERCAYGPGISDMKSGTLSALYAYNALPEEVKQKLNICILMNPDEEITSRYSRPYTHDIAKKTDYAFVLEASNHLNTYTNRRKGSGTYKIKFHGVPGHSGYIFDNFTANAVVEMANWATALHALNNKETLLSVNVATVNGGTAANVVPEFCEMTVNIRVVTKDQYDYFEGKLAELKAHPFIDGVTAEIEIISKNYPMVPAPGMDEWLERIRKTLRSIGQDLILYPIRGGCSDGNVIADAGTRVIDSIGPMSKGGHTNHEELYLDKIEPCIDRLVALICEICEYEKK